MAQSNPGPVNQVEDDQCLVGKIIDRWVCDKRQECLEKVDHKKECFCKQVQNALDKMFRAHKYDSLEEGIQDMEYEDPFFQFGYMYKHSMFSARSLTNIIQSPEVVEKFKIQVRNNGTGTINVACLGGGPGSDVLGVLDYFTKDGFEGKLVIHLYDRQDKWGPCWESLKTAINAELHDDRVTVSFHDFDVTTADKNKPDIENADIITMHFFMEEVYSERENPTVMECFDNIIQKAKPGTLFLYSGMYMYQAIDWVHQLLNNCKILTPGTELTNRSYRDSRTKVTEWIPSIKVDLKQEGDLKLFDDIKEELKIPNSTEDFKVSQRYNGEVVYRLYQK
ncbi:Hypp1190 [Branchiostoma lanceolatum]|uniref:Hypp1190 protein n=1 Tax=Branchiostoma lanceolatum TaxID=7740 RepID=A0A8J9ZF77_BRALA|nr:Hypp1190 [Branchiostoma lanceolatum]